ncbi:PfkB family carbohydrate kinase [Gluconobacter aidae]|uniref:Carbohydrate kinase PfkB domain-containing protein n=1 Tax=Gluconobacter aidae TaxID=2662454 RepID=A0A7X1VMH4_9PROT|nr:PfkB family carbohydrate kinase [Gluconobacter aidae]MQR98683.1 hypothetical protein [Gluconobacter aidae]
MHDGLRCVPGGAANVALSAATLRARVHLVGFMGKDDAAARLKETLKLWPTIVTQQASGFPARTDGEVLKIPEILSAQFGGNVFVTRSKDGVTPDRSMLPPASSAACS